MRKSNEMNVSIEFSKREKYSLGLSWFWSHSCVSFHSSLALVSINLFTKTVSLSVITAGHRRLLWPQRRGWQCSIPRCFFRALASHPPFNRIIKSPETITTGVTVVKWNCRAAYLRCHNASEEYKGIFFLSVLALMCLRETSQPLDPNLSQHLFPTQASLSLTLIIFLTIKNSWLKSTGNNRRQTVVTFITLV